MTRITKHLRSPLFLCFAFLILLTIVSGLVLRKSRDLNIEPSGTGLESSVSVPEEIREVTIVINENDDIQVNETLTTRRELRPAIAELASGDRAIRFTLKNTDGASYATYVEVYDALRDAITSLRNKASLEELGRPYATLVGVQKQAIDEMYPLKVNEIFIASLERH